MSRNLKFKNKLPKSYHGFWEFFVDKKINALILRSNYKLLKLSIMNTIFIFSVVAILAIFIIAQVILKKLQSKNFSEAESNSDIERMVNAYRSGAQYKRARTRLWELMIIVPAVIALVAFAVIAILDKNKQDKQNVEKGKNQEQVSQTSNNSTFLFYLIPHGEVGYKAHYVKIKQQKVQKAQKVLSDIEQEMSEHSELYNHDLRSVELAIHQRKLAEAKAYSFQDYVKNTSINYLGAGCVLPFFAYLVYLLSPFFRRKKLQRYVAVIVCYILFLGLCQNMILHEYFG